MDPVGALSGVDNMDGLGSNIDYKRAIIVAAYMVLNYLGCDKGDT